jgi:hypothetical protein
MGTIFVGENMNGKIVGIIIGAVVILAGLYMFGVFAAGYEFPWGEDSIEINGTGTVKIFAVTSTGERIEVIPGNQFSVIMHGGVSITSFEAVPILTATETTGVIPTCRIDSYSLSWEWWTLPLVDGETVLISGSFGATVVDIDTSTGTGSSSFGPFSTGDLVAWSNLHPSAVGTYDLLFYMSGSFTYTGLSTTGEALTATYTESAPSTAPYITITISDEGAMTFDWDYNF